MAIADIKISNLAAINIGDGKTVALHWAVADVSLVKHFVIELYDPYSKAWKPYDGFHGTITASQIQGEPNPPQKATIEVPYKDQNASIRVKAIGKDLSDSEWSYCTVEVRVLAGADEEYSGATIYYVRDGLEVTKISNTQVSLSPGIAFLGGKTVIVDSSTALSVPADPNKSYLVYISKNGQIGLIEAQTTPQQSIRLANLIVDANGNLTVEDTRFLWPPELYVFLSPFDSTSYDVEWDAYSELNLKEWRIYKTTTPVQLDSSGNLVPPDNSKYEILATPGPLTSRISDSAPSGYINWYRISAADWGGHESALSVGKTFAHTSGSIDDVIPPSAPTGLTAAPMANGGVHIHLTWNPNPEDDIAQYRIYVRVDDRWVRVWEVNHPNTSYTHQWLKLGREYEYCITAIDTHGNESDKSSPVICVAGSTLPPAAPEWSIEDPIITGATGTGDTDCWVELNWYPVAVCSDGITPATFLDGYAIWAADGAEGDFRVIGATQDTTYKVSGVRRGAYVRFAITARDKFGRESTKSTEKSIVAGGPKPEPPVLVSVETFKDGTDKIKFTFQKSPSPNVASYKIYRGINPYIINDEIGEVASGEEQYVIIDSNVIRLETRYYSAIAISNTGTLSDMPTPLSVTVGDFDAPESPTIIQAYTQIGEDASINNVIVFSTNDEEDLRGVIVYRRAGYGPVQYAGTIPKDQTTYVHENVVNGVTYEYFLSAVDTSDNTSDPAEVQITAGSTVPPKVPLVSVDPFYDSSAGITISWLPVTKNTDDEDISHLIDGYEIWRSTTGMHYDYLTRLPAGEDSYEHNDTGLVNGKRYYYRVYAIDKLGNISGPGSADALAGDTVAPSMPSVIHNVQLGPDADSDVKVTLSITTSEPKYPVTYRIYTSNNGISYSVAGEVQYQETTATFEIVWGYKKRLYYKVVGLNVAGVESEAFSANLLPECAAAPNPVTSDVVVIDATQISNNLFSVSISWDAYVPDNPNLFDRYEIFISDPYPRPIASTTETEITLSSLTGGEYSIAIVPYNKFNLKSEMIWIPMILKDEEPPDAPSSISAEAKALSNLVTWTPVDAMDASYYEFVVTNHDTGIDSAPVIVPWPQNSYIHTCGYDQVNYKYKVRVVDSSGNKSAYVQTASPVMALPLSSGSFADNTPQTSPTWPVDAITVHVDPSHSTIWAVVKWNPVLNADHYNLYMYEGASEPYDDTKYHLKIQARSPETILTGLAPNAKYWLKVAAVGKPFSDEGPWSVATSFETGDLSINLPTPTGFKVIAGKNLLAVSWDKVTVQKPGIGSVALQNVQYRLEYRCTPNDIQDESKIWDPNWTELKYDDDTSYIHSSLEYSKRYQYRVKAIDAFGNESAYFPLDYEDNYWKPAQVGSQDIAAVSIYSDHIISEAIEGRHVTTEAIDTQHLKANAVKAGKIDAGAVTARELNISLGGYNYVLNSAFGMKDLEGNLGINWRKYIESQDSIADMIEEIDDAPINTSYCIHLDPSNPSIVQELPLSLCGKRIAFTFYYKTLDVVGEVIASIETPTKTITHTPDLFVITGSTSTWLRSQAIVDTIPADAESIILRIRLAENATGDFYSTGIKVEEGDVETIWTSHPDELYGSDGDVQINSSGVRIDNGRILFRSPTGNLIINSSGLIINPSDQNKYLTLTESGLTISTNNPDASLFSITSTAPGNHGFEISSAGIIAKKNGIHVLEYSSYTGNLTLTGTNLIFLAPDGSDGSIRINNEGLRAYKSRTEDPTKKTIELSSYTGKLLIRGGNMQFTTGTDFGDPNSVTIDHTGIAAPGFSLKASGLKIVNGVIICGNEDGSHLKIDQYGVALSDGSDIVFQASTSDIDGIEGLRLKISGAFKIESATGTNSVYIDSTGIHGPSFGLTAAEGLSIHNGNIVCGDVAINEGGIEIYGYSGLFLYTDSTKSESIASITSAGIQLQGGSGLNIVSSGAIKFSGETAIDKDGIRANAIKTGALEILGEGGPSIIVKEGSDGSLIAKLDKDGLLIEKGKLVVKDGNNNTVIDSNGINTDLLHIGMSAANMIKNGRAEYYDGVTFTGWQSSEVTRDTNWGRSAIYAFKFNGQSSLVQTPDPDDIYRHIQNVDYALAFDCYVWSGALTVSIDNVADPNNPVNIVTQTVSQKTEWQTIEIKFNAQSPFIRYSFTASTGSVAYLTDIRCFEGKHAMKFAPHPSEIAAAKGSVIINDSGMTISGGKINISIPGVAGGLTINHTGISSAYFSLDSSGLVIMPGGDNDIIISERGIEAFSPSDPNKWVTISSSSGLSISGGMIDVTIPGLAGSVTINRDGITAGSVGQNVFARLNSSGLHINGGAITINATDSGNRILLANNRLSVIDNEQEAVQLGLGVCGGLYNGLYIAGGKFRLDGKVDRSGYIDMHSNAIRVYGPVQDGKEDDTLYRQYSELTDGYLKFYDVDGEERETRTYVQNIICKHVTIPVNTQGYKVDLIIPDRRTLGVRCDDQFAYIMYVPSQVTYDAGVTGSQKTVTAINPINSGGRVKQVEVSYYRYHVGGTPLTFQCWRGSTRQAGDKINRHIIPTGATEQYIFTLDANVVRIKGWLMFEIAPYFGSGGIEAQGWIYYRRQGDTEWTLHSSQLRSYGAFDWKRADFYFDKFFSDGKYEIMFRVRHNGGAGELWIQSGQLQGYQYDLIDVAPGETVDATIIVIQ